MVTALPEIQYGKSEGGTEFWWYQEQGPHLAVHKNPYAPKFRRWEVTLYPTASDFLFQRDDWYHSAFPDHLIAVRAGRVKLEEAAKYYAELQLEDQE